MSTQTQSPKKKITAKTIFSMKKNGEKIAMLTAYDFITAKLLDEVGVEIILVGDSLANVFQGKETTLSVTLEEIIYHTKIVKRATQHAMVVADMPFMSYQVSIEDAIKNCGRVIKETGAEAVKIEGGTRNAELIKKLIEIGIPVMGHLGLTPQSINQFGSYEVRAAETTEAKTLLNEAQLLNSAGVFSIVLEKIPSALAEKVTKKVSCATIGIGAGVHCDGQVLVTNDILGMNEHFHPRFVRHYANLSEIMRTAFQNYSNDVKKSQFPNEKESY